MAQPPCAAREKGYGTEDGGRQGDLGARYATEYVARLKLSGLLAQGGVTNAPWKPCSAVRHVADKWIQRTNRCAGGSHGQ